MKTLLSILIVIASLIYGALDAMAAGQAGADLEPPSVQGQESAWAAFLAHTDRVVQQAAAAANAADERVRMARDAAAAYLHQKAAEAPRLRGVHFLTVMACSTDEAPEAQVDADYHWVPLAEATPKAEVTLLIHGLDEPGRVWDDLAPVLHEAGHIVARFDYPNDQAVTASTAMLAAALRDLRAAGVTRINMVGHSKGGLIARDVLTHPDHYGGSARGHKNLPDVPRLITLGSPNHGSPWAHLQCLSDAAEQVDRFLSAPEWDGRHLLGFLADGRGEAARDLLPGSEYLKELNARPLPTGVRMTTVIAVIDSAAPQGDQAPVESGTSRTVSQRLAEFRAAAGGRLGDGVVSTASAHLDGVTDTVIIEASHRGMVRSSRLENAVRWAVRARQDQPPAIPIIVERLGAPVTDVVD